MRAAWIANLPGSYGTIDNQAIWDRVARWELTRIYLDARQATVADIDAIHARRCEAGIFRVQSWTSGMTAVDLARTMDADLTRIGANSRQCASMLDCELHDSVYMRDWLREFRTHRPGRWLAWSLEPLQGGWFSNELVAAIRNDPNLRVLAYCYRNDMQPVAPDAVWRDLNARLPIERCQLFYDGRMGAPEAMNGCVFTLERLP